ncbi:MAG: hypothetical protein AAF383_23995 [Cyanobacteria bacterium P01_A01_bin.83]
MTFYILDQNQYAVREASNILNKINSESLVRYVNRGINESPLIIKQDFLRVI